MLHDALHRTIAENLKRSHQYFEIVEGADQARIDRVREVGRACAKDLGWRVSTVVTAQADDIKMISIVAEDAGPKPSRRRPPHWPRQQVPQAAPAPASESWTGPDFDALFPLPPEIADSEKTDEDDEMERDWVFTPRTALALSVALSVIADGIYDDIEAHGSKPVSQRGDDLWMALDEFPPITWNQGEHWRARLARAADDLDNDLAAGNWPRPTCTAEEVVLYVAIEQADAEEPEIRKVMADQIGLPEHPDDYDIEVLYDAVFDDMDFIPLFDQEPVDGRTISEDWDWFKPFRSEIARDPKRGFRR